MKIEAYLAGLFAGLLALSGCGYTNKIVLPYDNAKTIAVPMFLNKIDPNHNLTYVASLETNITQAVIEDLVKDGNLKVTDEDKADLILRGHIIAYEQEPFRFNRFEQVQEYRLFLVVKLMLEDRRTGKTIWTEERFSGDAQYFIATNRVIPEEQAANKAITDLAEKVANRVVEEW